ncbi:uncharacterized protein SOCE836_108210 [Sorangium cellulosum]|uniref:Uncharacterized protein n=1 Tax=Sorangium cellulosum TaxID=56 RepID=A0A4P2R5Z8_SORCE|nr:uncharacterized protein SOCE836_108210 [Sorangium cellulosum]
MSARTVARWRAEAGGEDGRAGPRHAPVHKLTEAERRHIVETANSPEFRNLSPKQIVPRLADRGVYLASESSFYRILREQGLLAHRNPARPATAHRPRELVARRPNQVWCWDITYLKVAAPLTASFPWPDSVARYATPDEGRALAERRGASDARKQGAGTAACRAVEVSRAEEPWEIPERAAGASRGLRQGALPLGGNTDRDRHGARCPQDDCRPMGG